MADMKKIGKANKKKGSNYERKIANIMSKYTGQRWKRTPYSGAGHISGDVFCLDFEFPYVIELKNRRDLSLLKVFKNPQIVAKYLEDNTILVFNDSGTDIILVPFEPPEGHSPLYGNRRGNLFFGSILIGEGTNARGYDIINLKEFCNAITHVYGDKNEI